MWYMIRNFRCTVTIDSDLANSKTQNTFLFTVNAIFRHDYPLAVLPVSTPRPLVQKTWRVSLSMDMLLSAMSVLVVAQSSSEIPEGLMNNYVCVSRCRSKNIKVLIHRVSTLIAELPCERILLCDNIFKWPCNIVCNINLVRWVILCLEQSQLI